MYSDRFRFESRSDWCSQGRSVRRWCEFFFLQAGFIHGLAGFNELFFGLMVEETSNLNNNLIVIGFTLSVIPLVNVVRHHFHVEV